VVLLLLLAGAWLFLRRTNQNNSKIGNGHADWWPWHKLELDATSRPMAELSTERQIAELPDAETFPIELPADSTSSTSLADSHELVHQVRSVPEDAV
jgi:hypothetical protein